MSNPEDHWFNDGPPVPSSPFFDPDWRFGTGAFFDFLFCDRAAGLGEFYWHGPVFPLSPLDGYITPQITQGGALVATGSVLPGESIAFHLSSQSAPYSIRIYQQGLFAGEPEQFMAEIAGLPRTWSPTPFRRVHGETALSGRPSQPSSFRDGPEAFIWLACKPRGHLPQPSIFHSSCVRPLAQRPVLFSSCPTPRSTRLERQECPTDTCRTMTSRAPTRAPLRFGCPSVFRRP
jgi:hypothetical protein